MPTVATNGIHTYYERRGTGPPIVFVHGPIIPHTVWSPQLSALADDHTAVAYDWRGHGQTGGSDADTYTVRLLAEDLAALVDALALEQPVVCGLSMGGFIAQAYAAADPDRVAGLVLVDPFTPGILDVRERLLRRVLLPSLVQLGRIVGFPRVERLGLRLAARIPHAKVQRLELDWPPMETDEFAKILHALAHADQEPVDLSALTVPTLIVQGADDADIVHRQTRRLADTLPEARVEVIADAGHGCHLVHPERVNSVLRGFLAEVQS